MHMRYLFRKRQMKFLAGVIFFDSNGVQQTYTTGASITSDDFNALIDDGAGGSLVSGSRTVMVGALVEQIQLTTVTMYLLVRNTTFDNTFVGAEAGENNNEGTDNTFIREESGTNNVSGSKDSCYSNITGAVNTFIGSGAGRFNTTAIGNTFVGGDTGTQTTIDAFFGNLNKYDLDTFTVRGSGYGNTTFWLGQ